MVAGTSNLWTSLTNGRCPRLSRLGVSEICGDVEIGYCTDGGRSIYGTRHEVCAAARGEERRGDPGILCGGVGAVREGKRHVLTRHGEGLRRAIVVDDAEPVSYGARRDRKRCV
jgi:hypothetical protein